MVTVTEDIVGQILLPVVSNQDATGQSCWYNLVRTVLTEHVLVN